MTWDQIERIWKATSSSSTSCYFIICYITRPWWFSCIPSSVKVSRGSRGSGWWVEGDETLLEFSAAKTSMEELSLRHLPAVVTVLLSTNVSRYVTNSPSPPSSGFLCQLKSSCFEYENSRIGFTDNVYYREMVGKYLGLQVSCILRPCNMAIYKN